MKASAIPNCIYRHYKGGKYLILTVAETHFHDGSKDVVYISLKKGKAVTRPLRQDRRKEDAWMDIVEWPDGHHRPRFVLEVIYRSFGRSTRGELRRLWRKLEELERKEKSS